MLPIIGRLVGGTVKKKAGKKAATIKASTQIKNLQQAGSKMAKETNVLFMQDYLNKGVKPMVKPPGIFSQAIEKGKDFVEDVAATGVETGEAFTTNTEKLAESAQEAAQEAKDTVKSESKAIPKPITGGMVNIKKPVAVLRNAGGITLLLVLLLFIHFAVVTVKTGANGEQYTRLNLLLKTLVLKTQIADVADNGSDEVEGTRSNIGGVGFYETQNGNVKMDSGNAWIDTPTNALSGFGQTIASPIVDGVSGWIVGGLK